MIPFTADHLQKDVSSCPRGHAQRPGGVQVNSPSSSRAPIRRFRGHAPRPRGQFRRRRLLIFKHLGLKPGDEVVLPAYREPLLLEILSLFDATPRFIDLKEGSYSSDLALVRPPDRAHPGGDPRATPSVFPWRSPSSTPIALVEDCTHALGSTRAGVTPAGGTSSVFSLDAKNIITAGEGGMVLCGRNPIMTGSTTGALTASRNRRAHRPGARDLQSAMGVSRYPCSLNFWPSARKWPPTTGKASHAG